MPDLNDEIHELRKLRARVSEATEVAEEHFRKMLKTGEVIDEMLADREGPGDGDEVAAQRRRHLNIGSGVLWSALSSANTIRESQAAVAVARATVAGATALVVWFPGGIDQRQPGDTAPRPRSGTLASRPAAAPPAAHAGPHHRPSRGHAQPNRPERPRALAVVKPHPSTGAKKEPAQAAAASVEKRGRVGKIRLRKIAVGLLWRR